MSSSCDTSMFFAVHSWSPLQMSFGRQCLHFPQVIFCPPFLNGVSLSLHSHYSTFSRKSQVFSEKIFPKRNLKSQNGEGCQPSPFYIFTGQASCSTGYRTSDAAPHTGLRIQQGGFPAWGGSRPSAQQPHGAQDRGKSSSPPRCPPSPRR